MVAGPAVRRLFGRVEESQPQRLPRLAQGTEVFDQGEHGPAPPAVLVGVRPEGAGKKGRSVLLPAIRGQVGGDSRLLLPWNLQRHSHRMSGVQSQADRPAHKAGTLGT